MRFLKLSALFVTMCLSLSSCSGGKQETKFASTSPADPSDPNQAPSNVVNNIGFYMKNDTDKYVHYMTKGTSFNTDCNIPTNSTSSQDINCRVDAIEGDLRFHGLKLNYNVPSTMCYYLRVKPFFYYNWETGHGPSAVSLDILTRDGVSSVTACSVTTETGTNTSCSNQPEVKINTTSGALSCVYDHTDSGGPNCCLGGYNLTKNMTTITTDASGVQTTTNSTDATIESWNGAYSSCIGGQAKVAWSKFSKSGFPAAAVYFTKDIGANNTMTIAGPLADGRAGNYQIANYYDPALHSHSDFYSIITSAATPAVTSTMPYAVDPIDDRDGSRMLPAQDAYQIECLDQAYEVKHRIRLYVQEWNTLTDFLTYASSSGASGNPNITGNEGTSGSRAADDCDYSNVFNTEPCNDAGDFDDIVRNGSSSYDQTAIGNRGSWFPSEDY